MAVVDSAQCSIRVRLTLQRARCAPYPGAAVTCGTLRKTNATVDSAASRCVARSHPASVLPSAPRALAFALLLRAPPPFPPPFVTLRRLGLADFRVSTARLPGPTGGMVGPRSASASACASSALPRRERVERAGVAVARVLGRPAGLTDLGFTVDVLVPRAAAEPPERCLTDLIRLQVPAIACKCPRGRRLTSSPQGGSGGDAGCIGVAATRVADTRYVHMPRRRQSTRPSTSVELGWAGLQWARRPRSDRWQTRGATGPSAPPAPGVRAGSWKWSPSSASPPSSVVPSLVASGEKGTAAIALSRCGLRLRFLCAERASYSSLSRGVGRGQGCEC
jgi:hypothetical protein